MGNIDIMETTIKLIPKVMQCNSGFYVGTISGNEKTILSDYYGTYMKAKTVLKRILNSEDE